MDFMEALDKFNRIQSCFLAVSDLMAPGGDLHAVDRDNLAQLLDLLRELQNECLAALAKAHNCALGYNGLG